MGVPAIDLYDLTDYPAPTPELPNNFLETQRSEPKFYTAHLDVDFDYTWNRRDTVPAKSKVTAVWSEPDEFGQREVALAFKAPHDAWNRRLGRQIALGRLKKGKHTLLLLDSERAPIDQVRALVRHHAPSRWSSVEVLEKTDSKGSEVNASS